MLADVLGQLQYAPRRVVFRAGRTGVSLEHRLMEAELLVELRRELVSSQPVSQSIEYL